MDRLFVPNILEVAEMGNDADNMTMLPEDFVPNACDVICQRGKESFDHAGNRQFRKHVEESLDSYVKATSRQEKSKIVGKIYDIVMARAKKEQHVGGFVKKDLLTRRWYRVSTKDARDKIGQALRDSLKIVRASARKKKAGAAKSCMVENKRLRLDSTLWNDSTSELAMSGDKLRGSPVGDLGVVAGLVHTTVNQVAALPTAAAAGGSIQPSSTNAEMGVLGTSIGPLDRALLNPGADHLNSFLGKRKLGYQHTWHVLPSFESTPQTTDNAAANSSSMDGQLSDEVAERLRQTSSRELLAQNTYLGWGGYLLQGVASHSNGTAAGSLRQNTCPSQFFPGAPPTSTRRAEIELPQENNANLEHRQLFWDLEPNPISGQRDNDPLVLSHPGNIQDQS